MPTPKHKSIEEDYYTLATSIVWNNGEEKQEDYPTTADEIERQEDNATSEKIP